MPKFLNKILNIKNDHDSESRTNVKSKHKKVVVFDLDETLGSFGQLGSFCMLLDDYYNDENKAYSMFNELMDLYPEYPRPYILNVLKYLLQKKKDEKCKAVMIYTNNQGERAWVEHIKAYFETKLKSKIFEQIISAFKVDGKIVEVNRTTQDKTIDDFFRCTKLPKEIEICFVDDLFHPKMEDDNVYYIHVKGYKHYLPSSVIIQRFLKSNLAKDMKNNNEEKKKFTDFMMSRLNYNIAEKDPEEQEMDIIISKKMLEHMKTFFKEDKGNTLHDDDSIDTHPPTPTKKNININIKSKSFKKKQSRKNQTMKKK